MRHKHFTNLCENNFETLKSVYAKTNLSRSASSLLVRLNLFVYLKAQTEEKNNSLTEKKILASSLKFQGSVGFERRRKESEQKARMGKGAPISRLKL